MRQMILRNVAIATSTVACAALLSFGWSEQRGVSLRVESAQAADRSTADPHSAGGARRQYRRSVYGYGPGADPGAGLVRAAAAATTSPRNYDDYYYTYHGCYYYGAYGRYPGGCYLSFSYLTGLYGRPTLFPRYYGP
jgi:hypothetical protein